MKGGEYYDGRHAGSDSVHDFGCIHEILFAWTTASCDSAVFVKRSRGDSVSDITVASRLLRVTEVRKTVFEAGACRKGPDEMDATERNRTTEGDELIYVLSYSVLENVSDVTPNNSFYSLRHDCSELDRLSFQRGRLLLMFNTLPGSFTKAPNIVLPRPPQMKVTEPAEDVSVVMRADA